MAPKRAKGGSKASSKKQKTEASPAPSVEDATPSPATSKVRLARPRRPLHLELGRPILVETPRAPSHAHAVT